MRIALALAVMGLALPAAACPKEEMSVPEVPRARDGDVAIQEELDAARRAATVEAYDLFIARHPDHPLVPTAREERARLASRPR